MPCGAHGSTHEGWLERVDFAYAADGFVRGVPRTCDILKCFEGVCSSYEAGLNTVGEPLEIQGLTVGVSGWVSMGRTVSLVRNLDLRNKMPMNKTSPESGRTGSLMRNLDLGNKMSMQKTSLRKTLRLLANLHLLQLV